MKNSNNQVTNSENIKDIDLYLNMLALAIDAIEKLAQNNFIYSQTMLDNSLKFIEPLSNKNGVADLLTPLQSMLTETIQSNNKAYQKAHEIIAETANVVNKVVQEHHNNLSVSTANLFDWWRGFNPSGTELFRILTNVSSDSKMVVATTKRTFVDKRKNTK